MYHKVPFEFFFGGWRRGGARLRRLRPIGTSGTRARERVEPGQAGLLRCNRSGRAQAVRITFIMEHFRYSSMKSETCAKIVSTLHLA